VRSALADHDSLDRRPAAQARFTGATVNAVKILEAAALAGTVDVVGDRRAAVVDRQPQNFDNGAVKLLRAFA